MDRVAAAAVESGRISLQTAPQLSTNSFPHIRSDPWTPDLAAAIPPTHRNPGRSDGNEFSGHLSSKSVQLGEPPQFRCLLVLLFCFLNLPVRALMIPQSRLEPATSPGPLFDLPDRVRVDRDETGVAPPSGSLVRMRLKRASISPVPPLGKWRSLCPEKSPQKPARTHANQSCHRDYRRAGSIGHLLAESVDDFGSRSSREYM